MLRDEGSREHFQGDVKVAVAVYMAKPCSCDLSAEGEEYPRVNWDNSGMF